MKKLRQQIKAKILLISLCFILYADLSAQSGDKIKLVLQVTIDGLRNDLLHRYSERFCEGGFNYLLENGAVFSNAHYQHANTETIVGHTILATGAFPSENGMTGNVWYDRKEKQLAYNIEDADSPILPTREEIVEGAQVDPAQKMARTSGRSPKVILASTFGDELSVYTAGKSKVFGVSGKDRSAVSMAGHVGKAFWFSTNNGDFVTSKYYYDDYPQWVKEWNKKRKAESFAGKYWELLNPIKTYLLQDNDDRAYEADLKGYGRTFPHKFGEVEGKLLPTQIIVSPVGDQLTLDFSKSLIMAEELGKDIFPDYLSISFSGADAVNHFFGPSSLESEDLILQLDGTLQDLFNFIESNVGLKHTLIILSADHGIADMPEYMTELGYEVGRLTPDMIVEKANSTGKKLYDIDEMVRFFFRPYLYLNQEKINAAGINSVEVEKKIAESITEIEGVALAVPKNGLPDIQNSKIIEQVRRNYHPSRSGDIYVAQDPYWFLFDNGPVVNMHGSPWRYDTHVPIIFAGPDIKSREVYRLVHPVDVAPTISALLGLSPPSSASGSILGEVFE